MGVKPTPCAWGWSLPRGGEPGPCDGVTQEEEQGNAPDKIWRGSVHKSMGKENGWLHAELSL